LVIGHFSIGHWSFLHWSLVTSPLVISIPVLTTLRRYLELIRFSHTLFALPFALLAAVMAWATPTASGDVVGFQWRVLLGILVCMVAARSAAMAFNRLVDHRIDAANPRTKTRHIPAGLLSRSSVAWFTAASSLAFVGGTMLFLPENPLPIFLALPVLLFLCGYSYAKRFTSLAHYWLGMALALAPVCAWIAIRGGEVLRHPADLLPALLLGGAVWSWVAGFDIIYACQDAEFDQKLGLYSVPARFGVPLALRIAAASHLACVLLFAALPWLAPQVPLGWIYLSGVAIVAALLVYEHALVRPSDLTRLNLAFFNINVVISLGLFVVGTIDLLWR
jgi:4-hydroxybenzoate polyprenyltransferase